MKDAKIEVRQITPQEASILLNNQLDGQRNLRKSYVETLASEMTEGRWRLSSDAIVIINGKLANGQHRLTAVSLSRRQQPFIVMTSDDAELYKILDAGIKRTVSDVFSQVLNAKDITACASLVLRYDKGLITAFGGNGGKGTPRGEQIQFMNDNMELLSASITFCRPLYSANRIIPLSQSSAIYVLAKLKNLDGAEKFLSNVYDGGDYGTVEREMHQRAVKNATSTAKVPHTYMFGLLIKSLNAVREGKKSIMLRLTEGEDYPLLK